MLQSVYFALMLARYGSVRATDVQQACTNQKSDQYCQDAVSGSIDLCPSLFCPECDEAGSCDFTCGYCHPTTIASTSTSTTTGLPCLSVNIRDDAICEGSIILCEDLFCPSCAEAGQCDRTCKWCSTTTTLSSTGTTTSVPSSFTSTFTSTSKTGSSSSAISTTSSTSTATFTVSASAASVALMPTPNPGPEFAGDLRGARPPLGKEVPIGVLLVVAFFAVCAASLCMYWWHRNRAMQAPQRRPYIVEPAASNDTVGLSPTYPCEGEKESSPRSVHFWQPREAEGATGLVPIDVSASFDDDQGRSYTDEPLDDETTLECYAWDSLVCTQNVGTHPGTCTHRGFNCPSTGSRRLSRSAGSGSKSPRSSRPAVENEPMQAAERLLPGLEELRQATGVIQELDRRRPELCDVPAFGTKADL